ncbi:hypothetical protein BC628DRAFT_1336154 [Trametes gibbosa]|nr:hypothetical protein BC628DRAFT_1336154 [Trametes gibbosa]UVI59121.1 Zn(2)-Cys(6)19 [Trametes gibbosa]
MDRRYYEESSQTPAGGAPQQSPEDVLLWLDSVSGQTPGAAGNYDYAGQWIPAAPYPQPHAQQLPTQQLYAQQLYAQQPHVQQPSAQQLPQQHYQQQHPQQYPPQYQQQHYQYQQQQYQQQQFQQGSSSAVLAQPQAISLSHSESHDDYGGSSPGSTHSYSETESIESGGRGKTKVALDPSQPLTVDGKPRARVFVACDRCRIRKLRCDGAKPMCHFCQKVAHTGVECRYDPTPKRRGQDKAPRTRSAVGVRKPRRPAVKKDEREGGAGQSQS